MQIDSIGSSVLSTIQRTAIGGAGSSRLSVDPVDPTQQAQRPGQSLAQQQATVATSQTTAFAAPLSANAVTALQQTEQPGTDGRPTFGQPPPAGQAQQGQAQQGQNQTGQTDQQAEDDAQSLFRGPEGEEARPGESPPPPVGAPPPPQEEQRRPPPPGEEEEQTDEAAAQEEDSEEAVQEDEEGADGLTPEEEAQVRALQARDAEVRRHEQAHAAAGGQYAGAPTYEFERGPDGRLYAVGGEVSIDTTPIAGDPAASIAKAQQVRRAALAPANPSPQDQRVAAQAQQQIAQARAELRAEQAEEREVQAAARTEESQAQEAARSSGAEGGDAAEGVEVQTQIGVRQTAEIADAAAIASSIPLSSPPQFEVASRSLQSTQAFASSLALGSEQPRQGGFF